MFMCVDDVVSFDQVTATLGAVPHVNRVLGQPTHVGLSTSLVGCLAVRRTTRTVGEAVDPLETTVVHVRLGYH